ncbi:MAG: PHP domain-containing protein [Cytophagaceae bacterium]
MGNRDIIKLLKLASSLMELHDENPFKIRQYQNAVFKLEKVTNSLAALSEEEIAGLEDLGKSMASKISSLIHTGTFPDLSLLLEKTPPGVIEILNIKGVGPKKVRILWKDLNILSPAELLVACNENKVAAVKGFGAKTQETIKQSLLFMDQQKGRFLYAEVEKLALELEKLVKASGFVADASVSGEIRRKMEIVECIQIIAASDSPIGLHEFLDQQSFLVKNLPESGPFVWRGAYESLGLKVEVKIYPPEVYGGKLYLHSASREHLLQETEPGKNFYTLISSKAFPSEEAIFDHLNLSFIEPECREGGEELHLCREGQFPCLVSYSDLKGILHNHTTYSDGANTLEEMAVYCKDMGMEYVGISDHSKTAFYANGLKEDQIIKQHQEIDALNKKLSPFKIFKGIESDILNDGSLDYDDAVLASFDFIVASIHSNLNMSEDKATQRLITAIENPYTSILGHATGRLLLRREGYPIDHKKVIDACAANNVVIEINANPRRLDMDWRWVKYAVSKGVWISINPDAHSTEGYHDMQYGVHIGRKGCLPKDMTFNALPLVEVSKFFESKKKTVGV